MTRWLMILVVIGALVYGGWVIVDGLLSGTAIGQRGGVTAGGMTGGQLEDAEGRSGSATGLQPVEDVPLHQDDAGMF